MTHLARDPAVLRVVTYNIHKCRGMDGRVLPQRIADVLREVDADVVALQEVVRGTAHAKTADQLSFLAAELSLAHSAFGETRRWRNAPYGNAVLSRVPISHWENHNVCWRRREPRGCLRVDLLIARHAPPLHIFNTHLGTAFLERREQGRQLLSPRLLYNPRLTGLRMLLGDFNEWTHGLCSQMLCGELARIDLAPMLGRRARSYPGIFPMLLLDQIYFDRAIELKAFTLHRNRAALMASDHLPLSADFVVPLATPETDSLLHVAAQAP